MLYDHRGNRIKSTNERLASEALKKIAGNMLLRAFGKPLAFPVGLVDRYGQYVTSGSGVLKFKRYGHNS